MQAAESKNSLRGWKGQGQSVKIKGNSNGKVYWFTF